MEAKIIYDEIVITISADKTLTRDERIQLLKQLRDMPARIEAVINHELLAENLRKQVNAAAN